MKGRSQALVRNGPFKANHVAKQGEDVFPKGGSWERPRRRARWQGGGRSTWPVLGDAAGKELCPPKTGVCGRALPTACPCCCLHPAGCPCAEEPCGRAAGAFPAGKWGEATLPLSLAEHGRGGHDILGVLSWFASASSSHPPPALPLGKEEISRSGSSGSDEEV